MNGKTALKRLERFAARRVQRPQIRVIEVYCEDELLEVIQLRKRSPVLVH